MSSSKMFRVPWKELPKAQMKETREKCDLIFFYDSGVLERDDVTSEWRIVRYGKMGESVSWLEEQGGS